MEVTRAITEAITRAINQGDLKTLEKLFKEGIYPTNFSAALAKKLGQKKILAWLEKQNIFLSLPEKDKILLDLIKKNVILDYYPTALTTLKKRNRFDLIKEIYNSGHYDKKLFKEIPFIKEPIVKVKNIKEAEAAKNLLNKNFVLIFNKGNIAKESLLKLGYAPAIKIIKSGYSIEAEYWEYLMEGMSQEELDFWFPDPELNNWWVYQTRGYMIKSALESGSSFYLMFLAPELMYKSSKRPINNMDMFRTADNLVFKELVSEVVNFEGKVFNTIPVTRYAVGKSKGLFWTEKSEDNFCGTFYYFEPESTTYLLYQNGLKADNKIKAYQILSEITGEKDQYVMDTINTILNTESLAKFYNNRYPDNLIMALYEDSPQFKKYLGRDLGLYAKEDFLDQPICELAKKAGYDILILEKMVGSHQIVTEVLDVRQRGESFRSLVFLE